MPDTLLKNCSEVQLCPLYYIPDRAKRKLFFFVQILCKQRQIITDKIQLESQTTLFLHTVQFYFPKAAVANAADLGPLCKPTVL